MLVAELPPQLQERFEQTVQLLHRKGVQQALVEAIELWLSQQHQQIVDAEAVLNNQAFDAMREQLELQFTGKWIVIAHGQLLGVGDRPEELNELAPTARHRIVTQFGVANPKKIELGWQSTFV